METAPVRASPSALRAKRALRFALVGGGAIVMAGAALLQPFGASHLFPTPAGHPPIVAAQPTAAHQAGRHARDAGPHAATAPAAAAMAPAPPPISAASAELPQPPVAPPAKVVPTPVATAAPENHPPPPARLGPPPPPREPLPLQTDLIEPVAPAERSGALPKPAAEDPHG